MTLSLLLCAAHTPSSFPRTASFWTYSLSPTAFNSMLQLMPMRLPFRVPCTFESSSGRKASSQLSSRVDNPSLELPQETETETETWSFEVGNSCTPSNITAAPRFSFGSQALLLLCCMASLAFTGFVVAAVPTLFAMRRVAISLSKLADTACEEIPSTMAALRLSGMEISDLTLELSDLSQEIAETVAKSAQAVEVAEAGIRQIGSVARRSTMSMIQERANLPVISIQLIFAGAAKKTLNAVERTTKMVFNIISRRQDENSIGEDGYSSASEY